MSSTGAGPMSPERLAIAFASTKQIQRYRRRFRGQCSALRDATESGLATRNMRLSVAQTHDVTLLSGQVARSVDHNECCIGRSFPSGCVCHTKLLSARLLMRSISAIIRICSTRQFSRHSVQ